MEDRMIVRCTNGHQVKTLCAEEDCDHSSPICHTESCNNQHHHDHCNLILKVQKFIDSLMKKAASVSQVDDPVIHLYDHSIKTLTRDKEQYLKEKSILGFGLKQEERKLIQLINKGPVEDILPQLVSQVSKSLKKEPIVTAEKMDQQLAKDIQQLKKKMEDVMREVKFRWSGKEEKQVRIVWNQQWIFDKYLCVKGGMEISNDGKRIKRTAEHDEYFYFGVISRSLKSVTKVKRFEFKMVNDYCFFGIGYKNTLIKKGFKEYYDENSCIGRGVYLVSDSGWMYSHHNKDQDNQSSEFYCGKGDVVVLQVDMCLLKMVVFNKSSDPYNNKVTMDFIKQKGNPLHIIVGMCNNTQYEVQLVCVS